MSPEPREAKNALSVLNDAGIGLNRIVLLPMRSVQDAAEMTVAEDMLQVSGGRRFQSMTCLKACGISPRFCAVSWDKTAAWCSYTSERRQLVSLDAAGLQEALSGLGLIFCGATARVGQNGQSDASKNIMESRG